MPREGWLARAFENVEKARRELPDWVWTDLGAIPPKPSYDESHHPNRRKHDTSERGGDRRSR